MPRDHFVTPGLVAFEFNIDYAMRMATAPMHHTPIYDYYFPSDDEDWWVLGEFLSSQRFTNRDEDELEHLAQRIISPSELSYAESTESTYVTATPHIREDYVRGTFRYKCELCDCDVPQNGIRVHTDGRRHQFNLRVAAGEASPADAPPPRNNAYHVSRCAVLCCQGGRRPYGHRNRNRSTNNHMHDTGFPFQDGNAMRQQNNGYRSMNRQQNR